MRIDNHMISDYWDSQRIAEEIKQREDQRILDIKEEDRNENNKFLG